MRPLLELDQVSYVYAEGIPALSGVSLAVMEGERWDPGGERLREVVTPQASRGSRLRPAGDVSGVWEGDHRPPPLP